MNPKFLIHDSYPTTQPALSVLAKGPDVPTSRQPSRPLPPHLYSNSPMKRITSVLMAVLLGALATGIGMGIFLKLANDDRGRLATDVSSAKAEADRAEREKQIIAEDANRKVAEANAQISEAQRIIQGVQEERALMANAKPITKPVARDVRGWQTVVSLPQGLSLSIPPKTEVETNDGIALTSVEVLASSTQDFSNSRWLSITPYDARLESELLYALSTSTDASYLVNGHLLMGRIGKQPETQEKVAIFHVIEAASSTHLLWIKDPGTLGTGNGIERLLGTMEFKQ
jgi:hypothetical protein